jgi:hypothetical protein
MFHKLGIVTHLALHSADYVVCAEILQRMFCSPYPSQITVCVYLCSLLFVLWGTAGTPLCIAMYIDGEREVLTDHTFDLLCNKVSRCLTYCISVPTILQTMILVHAAAYSALVMSTYMNYILVALILIGVPAMLDAQL